MATFPVGSTVRLTAQFLRSTGQYTGSDAHGRWTVVECACDLCRSGRFVAVNEPVSNPEMYADLPEAERPRFRHFNAANLQDVRKPEYFR